MNNLNVKEIGFAAPVSTAQLAEFIDDYNPSMPQGLGGVPVNNLVRELIYRGYKVSVFSLSNDVEPGRIEIVKGKNLTIYYGSYRRSATRRKIDFFWAERRALARCIKMAKPDIIHAQWQYEFAWPAVDSGIKTVLTCHDAPLQVWKANKGMYRFVRLLMAIRNLRKYKNINAVSPYAVHENEKLTNTKIELITNFEPQWVFDLYRERKLPEKVRIAMINHGFGGRKNVALGIRAFNQLLKYMPSAELHLFGVDHGKNEEAYIFTQKNNLAENVFFHGALPFQDLMQKLVTYDLFLHTSTEESCPMVIIEAMAVGLPIVAGDKSGGVPWMLSEGGGILADVKSVDAVCNALREILGKDRYEAVSLEARKVAQTRFHPDIVVNQYLESYKKVLQ